MFVVSMVAASTHIASYGVFVGSAAASAIVFLQPESREEVSLRRVSALALVVA